MMPALLGDLHDPEEEREHPDQPDRDPGCGLREIERRGADGGHLHEADGLELHGRLSGRGVVSQAQHGRQETLDGSLKLVVVRARHAPNRLQRLGQRGTRIEAQHHSFAGAQQDAVVAWRGALVRAVEVLVDPGVDANPHRRPPIDGGGALGKLHHHGERLAVAVGVPAEIADVGNPREDEGRNQQSRPDVVEQAIVSRDRVAGWTLVRAGGHLTGARGL